MIKPQSALDEVEAFETQKISDALLASHGFDLQHLEIAMDHYETAERADFIAF